MDIKESFKSTFNESCDYVSFSSGRINLIGEHIDYQGGLVMPAAISLGTYGAIKFTNDNIKLVYSENFKDSGIINISDLDFKKAWCDYIIGSIKALEKAGHHIGGFKLYIYSNLPISSGLSSSASLELLVLNIFNYQYNLGLSNLELAKLGKDVENNYLNLSSGIMDQAAIALGKNNNAVLLNTSNLEYNYIPFDLGKYKLIIISSNKKRNLIDSKYNERVFETNKALDILKKEYNIKHICDLKPIELDKIKSLLNDDLLYRRVKHMITENDRVIQTEKYLENGDILSFCRILNESNKSLRYDYEVTGYHLDVLLDAIYDAGAIGARMIGAGFGGVAIAIIDCDLEDFKLKVNEKYKETGLLASFYEVKIVDGLKIEK